MATCRPYNKRFPLPLRCLQFKAGLNASCFFSGGSYARNEAHGKEIMHGGRYCHGRMAFIPRFAYCVTLCAFSSAYLTFSSFLFFRDGEVSCTSRTLALSNCCIIGGEILLSITYEVRSFLNSSAALHTNSRSRKYISKRSYPLNRIF